MQIFIQPSDVLLFRDGRPFSAGEGHRARSLFPPTPNTMQGVIRSKILADRCGRYQQYKDGCLGCSEQNNCTIPEEIGQPAKNGEGHYGKMQLRGALIAKYEPPKLTAYFPIPADIVKVKEKNSSAPVKLRLLQPLKVNPPGQNDLDSHLLLLWNSETNPVEAVQGYLNSSELSQYLLSDCPETFTKSDDLYKTEPRFGIEVENSKQIVKEGRLYQTEFIRCNYKEKVGLYVEIDRITKLSADPDPERGLIAIGGENRVASYDKIEGINWAEFKQQLKDKLHQSDGFKIYLATPTIFKQGWLPDGINAQTLEGVLRGIAVKLVSATIGRYQTIGGWDVAYNRHKPTRRAVAAGSVYYFTTQASPEEIVETFHWQNLADDDKEAQIGFGLSLVGVWNYCEL